MGGAFLAGSGQQLQRRAGCGKAEWQGPQGRPPQRLAVRAHCARHTLSPPPRQCCPHRGEIYLSIATAQWYAPWVRTIYIVVPDGQGRQLRLDFFQPDLRKKLRVVNESEFIPSEFLPTFSSIVVESFLHRIPGIAQHFMCVQGGGRLAALLRRSKGLGGTQVEGEPGRQRGEGQGVGCKGDATSNGDVQWCTVFCHYTYGAD